MKIRNNGYSALAAITFFLGGSVEAIVINPVFTDGAGESWTVERKATVSEAISQWQTSILDNYDINMEFTFENAGASYLGNWGGQISATIGSDIYPWSGEVTHTIRFNADQMDQEQANYLWFDSTPETDGDLPSEAWDALTVTKHELSHALGFVDNFYLDDFGNTDHDKWSSLITDTTFDPGGLNIEMEASDNLSHVADAGITSGDLMITSLTNGQRRNISQTDLDMLSLAYGYNQIPEPSSLILLISSSLLLFGRRLNFSL